MVKKSIWAAAVALALGGGVSAYMVAFAAAAASPVDPNRPDCPGQIVCPLTGELVCRDRCPASGETQIEELPSCCRGER